TPAGAEIPAVGCVSADALATQPLHAHGAARSFPDHRPFQLGEDGSHLCHGSPGRTAHVESFGNSYELDAFLVEVGNDGGGVGYGSKEPVQLRDDDDSFAFFHGGEELAAWGTSCKGLAATDSRILEDLGEVESLHGAVGGDALALGFESEATIGLFFA